jgi:hypothetical protein
VSPGHTCAVVLAALLVSGCGPKAERAKCPSIEKYAEVHGLKKDDYEAVYRYSEQHGPKFGPDEKRELTAWRVK